MILLEFASSQLWGVCLFASTILLLLILITLLYIAFKKNK